MNKLQLHVSEALFLGLISVFTFLGLRELSLISSDFGPWFSGRALFLALFFSGSTSSFPFAHSGKTRKA
jgi:hypothetical protein